MNSGQKITGELVISRGDAPEVLEPAKAAFDDISSFVGAFVEAMDDDTVRFIGDYRLGAAKNDFAAKLVAIIPFVGEEHAHGWRERQDIVSRSDISILAWSQMQDDRPAERIAQRMDFCRAASARAADCLIVLPPFPPEAHR
ncbi:transposase [Bradyrhizobium sp. CCBAU 11386]|nr:transposase [Bradyrhizobium sp. CCBAU 11361]MDA9503858.1 transposase [Bradyrhizobium sp. CCBAU 11386]